MREARLAPTLLHHVLQMFESLERSLDRLSAEQVQTLGEHAELALRFHGFDFNDHYEARLASYAQYLVDIGRWSTMAVHFDDAHDGGNSHAPMLAAYERVLTVWRPKWSAKFATFGGPDNYLFSPDELRQVQRAWPYPG